MQGGARIYHSVYTVAVGANAVQSSVAFRARRSILPTVDERPAAEPIEWGPTCMCMRLCYFFQKSGSVGMSRSIPIPALCVSLAAYVLGTKNTVAEPQLGWTKGSAFPGFG